MCMFCLHVCTRTMGGPGVCGGQERVLDLLAKSQMVVSYHVGTKSGSSQEKQVFLTTVCVRAPSPSIV